MFEIQNMPLLPGQNQGRVVNEVPAEDLAGIGVSRNAFGMNKGDVITFDNDEKPLVVSQKIRDDANSPLAYYVAVTRNGKPSWLSTSVFNRRDHEGKPVTKFQEKMLELGAFNEWYAYLKGKTLVGGKVVTYQSAVFDGDVRTDKLRTQRIPEIEILEQ